MKFYLLLFVVVCVAGFPDGEIQPTTEPSANVTCNKKLDCLDETYICVSMFFGKNFECQNIRRCALQQLNVCQNGKWEEVGEGECSTFIKCSPGYQTPKPPAEPKPRAHPTTTTYKPPPRDTNCSETLDCKDKTYICINMLVIDHVECQNIRRCALPQLNACQNGTWDEVGEGDCSSFLACVPACANLRVWRNNMKRDEHNTVPPDWL